MNGRQATTELLVPVGTEWNRGKMTVFDAARNTGTTPVGGFPLLPAISKDFQQEIVPLPLRKAAPTTDTLLHCGELILGMRRLSVTFFCRMSTSSVGTSV